MPLGRVVITGMGVVSPFGQGNSLLMENLYAGNSAVKNMQAEWQEKIIDLDCLVGAPVQGEINEKVIPRQHRKTMGRTAVLSYLAAYEAIGNAGLNDELLQSGRLGLSFSSTTGSTQVCEEMLVKVAITKEKREISSGSFFKIMSHTAASNIALAFNVKGRVISPNCACSSSGQAIGLAYETIKHGYQDIMLCGGSDELQPVTSALFDQVKAASISYNDRPDATPRPFDTGRDGTVCGEGAGCLVLESEESALKRGVPIWGEITGFSTLSGGVHISNPDTESIVRCIDEALADAHLTIEEVDYINAHATGTQIGDAAEAKAISEVFKNNAVPVSSFKGYIGHTLGASAAIELIGVLHMMKDNKIIPNRNLEEKDREYEDLNLIKEVLNQKINVCIKNSFAFGGINTVLVIRRY